MEQIEACRPANVDDKEQTNGDVENDDERDTEYNHERQS